MARPIREYVIFTPGVKYFVIYLELKFLSKTGLQRDLRGLG